MRLKELSDHDLRVEFDRSRDDMACLAEISGALKPKSSNDVERKETFSSPTRRNPALCSGAGSKLRTQGETLLQVLSHFMQAVARVSLDPIARSNTASLATMRPVSR